LFAIGDNEVTKNLAFLTTAKKSSSVLILCWSYVSQYVYVCTYIQMLAHYQNCPVLFSCPFSTFILSHLRRHIAKTVLWK
jgi:hypothetical protein